jgi:hypothetical protein
MPQPDLTRSAMDEQIVMQILMALARAGSAPSLPFFGGYRDCHDGT